jgi:hypothetical protein
MEGAIAIRIQLGAMPNMLGEIVEQMLRAFPQLRVVGRPPFAEGLIAAARQAKADLVLLCEADPAIRPLEEFHDLSFFTLAESGREGTLISLRRRRFPLDEGGLADLRELIADKGGFC